MAKVLLLPPRDLTFSKETTAQLQQQGVALLQAYLQSPQERDANDEIRARYELGHYFVKRDMITEALQALEIGQLKPPSRNSQAGMYYTQLLKLNAQLTQKLNDMEGAK